jgi:hypothetical protein
MKESADAEPVSFWVLFFYIVEGGYEVDLGFELGDRCKVDL